MGKTEIKRMNNEDGFICVSGSARTGTSMLMQTLIHLGIPTPAQKFISQHKDIKQYNPKGFYEMYDEVINGVNHDNYKGQCVKLFAGCLLKTDPKFISKVIVCKRNKADAIKSYEPISEIIVSEHSPTFIYEATYRILYRILPQLNHIFVNFEEIRSNPKKEIERIIDFLEINPSEEQINNAIKNIDLWQY